MISLNKTQNLKSFFLKSSLFVAVLLLIAFISSFSVNKSVQAQTPSNVLSGYAWSENIGWIDFSTSTNNVNGVSIDANGNLSGYAWSENIGWIKFGGLSGFPTGTAGELSQDAKIVSGKLTGWARACAGTASGDCSGASRTDGWDGWISLGGTNYGIIPSGNNFSGYAWGSDVIGWIDFSNVLFGGIVAPTLPTATISASPLSVDSGSASNISWISTNANSCSITKNGSSWQTGTSSVPITSGSLTTSTTFAINCTGNGGTASNSVIVTIKQVVPPPPPPPPAETTNRTVTVPVVDPVTNETVPVEVVVEVTVEKDGSITERSKCIAFQSGSNQTAGNLFINTPMAWVVPTTHSIISTKWGGTNITTYPNSTTFNKTYTTIGKKTINATSTDPDAGGATGYTSICSNTVILSAPTGTSTEI